MVLATAAVKNRSPLQSDDYTIIACLVS